MRGILARRHTTNGSVPNAEDEEQAAKGVKSDADLFYMKQVWMGRLGRGWLHGAPPHAPRLGPPSAVSVSVLRLDGYRRP